MNPWDAAIDFFKQHNRPYAAQACERMKRRGKEPPTSWGTTDTGRDTVQWGDRIMPLGWSWDDAMQTV